MNKPFFAMAFFLFWFPSIASAATINAASCSYADVQTAINASQYGDTVMVPAGSCTWTSTLSITKGIYLIGNGVGSTIIKNNANGNYLIRYNPSDYSRNDPVRISGFTFDLDNKGPGIDLGDWSKIAPFTIQTKARIDHNRFYNAPNDDYQAIWNRGTVRGLVDNNAFDSIAYPTRADASVGGSSWWDSFSGIQYGTGDDNLYFEDNTFTDVSAGIISDCEWSGRYLFRYNTMTIPPVSHGSYPLFDMHGDFPGGGEAYSCFGGEIYGNKIDAGIYGVELLDQRGGKALVFYNDITAGDGGYIQVRNEFADSPTTNPIPQHVSDSYYWNNRVDRGYVNELLVGIAFRGPTGTATGGGNNYLEDTGENFDFCASTCSLRGLKIVGGTGTGQFRQISTITSTRIILASNWATNPDATSQYEVLNDCCNSILDNRDFFSHNESFNGASGMGCGTLANRPASCTTGVGYWATTQSCSSVDSINVGANPASPISGTLYKCTSPNTWTAYYTPYTYPHPLRTDCVNYPGLCDSSLPLPKVYWVSPTGTSAWTNCHSATALDGTSACSLATANANAVAGDTIYLRAGNYNTSVYPARNGTSTNRITFKNYAGEKPVITGIDYGLRLGQRSYITVDGIDTVGVRTFLDARGAEHIWVFNANLVNSSDTGGWPVGIRMYNNAMYNWIANCTIGRSGYYTSTDDIGGVFNLGSWENPTDTTSYNLIENNHFYHGGHHIIEIASRYNILRNNTFHNEDWSSCPSPLTGNLCGNRDVIIADDMPDAYWNVLEGNSLSFAGNSIDDTAGSSGASVRTQHNIIRYNLFYHNAGSGLGLPTDSTGVYDARNNHVYHNVFYHNAYSPLNSDDYRYNFSLVFDNWAGNSAAIPITGVVIKNNIFYKNSNGDIFFYYTNESSQTVLGNYYSFMHASNSGGRYTPSIPAQNIKSSLDPGFVDITRTASPWDKNPYDFHLLSTSPAIDAGVFLTTTTSSGSGTEIQVADAGYFIDGYGIVEGDVIQLQGQTAKARIVSIDYATNTMTIDTPLSWTSGLGVSLPYEGAAPDIGAYEYINASIPPPAVPGDINGDRSVDINDLALMALHFGQKNSHPLWNATADVVANNEIDIFDVVFVASRFT